MRVRAFVMGVASASLVALVGAVPTFANGPDAKLQAPIYKTSLVQAMDQCAVGTTVILGTSGCAPSNTTLPPPGTDGTPFNAGKLLVKSKSTSPSQVLTVLKSSGNGNTGAKGALAGKMVSTHLTVRVTRTV